MNKYFLAALLLCSFNALADRDDWDHPGRGHAYGRHHHDRDVKIVEREVIVRPGVVMVQPASPSGNVMENVENGILRGIWQGLINSAGGQYVQPVAPVYPVQPVPGYYR